VEERVEEVVEAAVERLTQWGYTCRRRMAAPANA
jgi:hypothetical protein